MLKQLFVFGLFLVGIGLSAQSSSLQLSGKVIDEISQKPIIGATVTIKSEDLQNKVGVTTDNDGNFLLITDEAIPFQITVSYLGYFDQKVSIQNVKQSELMIRLQRRPIDLEEVVVVGDKGQGYERNRSVEQLSSRQILALPQFDFYEALGTLKGVDITTQSLQFQSVNTRGFNETRNKRFVQLVDGVDTQAPGLGFALGNFAGVSELDVKRVDLLPGPASSRYGPNAFNGVLILKGFDPFEKEGLSVSVKFGANRFEEGIDGYFARKANEIIDVSARFAKVINQRVGFKLNFGFIRALDWTANNFANIGAGQLDDLPFVTPSFDGINVYGDEVQAKLPLGPFGGGIVVNRTGYSEENLVDYNFTNFKLNAALYYRISDDWNAVIQANYGRGNTLYTGDNRIALNGFQLLQLKAELSNSNFLLRVYTTQQFSGNSYDSRSLALQLMRAARPDAEWFRAYQLAFEGALISKGIKEGDHEEARKAADSGVFLTEERAARYVFGTPQFNTLRDKFINTLGDVEGAGFRDDSKLHHLDLRYNLEQYIKVFKVELGANYRFYDPETFGIIFPDSLGNDISLFEFGGFVRGEKSWRDDKIIVSASLRLDKNERFSLRLTPRAGIRLQLAANHQLRTSIQTGFRNPVLRELFIAQNLGAAQLTGGLEELYNPLSLPGNAFLVQSVDRFNQAVDLSTTPSGADNPVLTQDQAELKHLPILETGILQSKDVQAIRPEKVQTFEVGYKLWLLDRRIKLDAVFYYNRYQDFIGQLRVIKPKTSPALDPFLAARQANNSSEREQFFIFNNARHTVSTQGLDFSLDYYTTKGWLFNLNGAWTNFNSVPDDPVFPGFNTPKWKFNAAIGYDRLGKWSFKTNLRNRQGFDWISSFGDGFVEGYTVVDVQISRKIKAWKAILKIGVSNITNNYYTNTFGGPRIGALPFVQLLFDPTLF